MSDRETTKREAICLLTALYELSRANLPIDLGVLAGRLGWGVGRVVRVLAHLEAKGVADRERCRLTMTGLALAVAVETAKTASTAAA